jgi:hypothetical protein
MTPNMLCLMNEAHHMYCTCGTILPQGIPRSPIDGQCNAAIDGDASDFVIENSKVLEELNQL